MKQQDFENHLANIKEYLNNELSKMRVGRATTALVEDIQVEAYEGSPAMPLNELASITIPDSQSLVISPWDKSIIKQIESSLVNSDKGLNPVNEGDHIRVPVPPLTEERRKEMVKEISHEVEQSKIKVRTLRQDVIKAIEEQQENGVITEDDMYRQKKEVDAQVSDVNKELDGLGEQKEQELMTV